MSARQEKHAPTGEQTSRVTGLKKLGGDVEDALERIAVPAYVIDRNGIIRWLNSAALQVIGDVRGRHVTSVLAPEERLRGHEIFLRNLTGPRSGSTNRGVVLGPDGERVTVELSAVPLEAGGHVIGVFGQVKDVEELAPPAPHPHLTPRQVEVLRHLERGRSTEQIAAHMGLSVETVRNHIRGVLRALGCHSRLEAVAIARQDRLTE